VKNKKKKIDVALTVDVEATLIKDTSQFLFQFFGSLLAVTLSLKT
jgi:hypothetical protein